VRPVAAEGLEGVAAHEKGVRGVAMALFDLAHVGDVSGARRTGWCEPVAAGVDDAVDGDVLGDDE
jgi:hypothetical protein